MIPTFDLVLSYEGEGVIVVRRKIAAYKGVWALPGLRMYKPESIDAAIRRIAGQELELDVDPAKRQFLGQYVGRFRTERGPGPVDRVPPPGRSSAVGHAQRGPLHDLGRGYRGPSADRVDVSVLPRAILHSVETSQVEPAWIHRCPLTVSTAAAAIKCCRLEPIG